MPRAIEGVLQELKERGVLTPAAELSQEEQALPSTFVEQREYTSVEAESWEPLKVESGSKVEFGAFLDGVQRTMMVPYRVPLPNGAQVPLHIAHIAAGVFLRDDSGRLYMEPDLVTARLLLVGPFHGIEDAGGTRFESLKSGEIVWDTCEWTFAFPNEPNEWIVCDTTYRGTSEERSQRRDGALLRDELFNEGLIRSRAQGRVATLRQRLEFAVLAKFRSKHRDTFILVDGPLFFLDKWRERAARALAPFLHGSHAIRFEDDLLRNAVGLIKTHRLRPKHPEQVLRIGSGQRSPVVRISEEVDVKGRRGDLDDDGSYAGAHLSWYTRLRLSQGDSSSFGLQDLIRLDVHRTTFGIESADALKPETFRPYKLTVDGITQGVWRERWPAVDRVGEIYPIEQLEKVLKTRLYPRRLLQHVFNIPPP